MRFLALALLLASADVFAGDWLVGSVTSYHVHRRGQNELNPGLGVELEVSERWRAVGGVYLNSTNRVSVYAGAVHVPVRWGVVRLGTLAGFATGYDGKPIFIAGPVLAIEGRDVGLNVIFFPADKKGVFGVQLKVPLR